MSLCCFLITSNAAVNGLWLTSGTAESKGPVTDVPLPAKFLCFRQEDNIKNYYEKHMRRI